MLSVKTPFPDYAWPRVWQWIQPFRHRVTDDYSPGTVEEFVRGHIERARQAQTYGVWRGDELGGLIWIEYANPVLCQSHVLFKQSFWGRATTEAAIRQVYDVVFANGVQKIGSFVFANNHAILALAKSLGAREEGVLRSHTRRNGLPVDMIALGLLKEDYIASSTNRSGHHDGRLDDLGRSEQPKENVHVLKHADVHPGTAALAETAVGDARIRVEQPEQYDLAA